MANSLLEGINKYCEDFFIPQQYLMEILEDQKVLPMIRGKASEYNAYLYLKEHLDSMIWDVQKLNLNAQNDMIDEDVSITHRRTGIRLKMEVKNAVRGSFKDENRSKKETALPRPYFNVKCHKSRSNTKKLDTTNDRYLIGEFDIVMSNTSNALYEGGSVDAVLSIIDKPRLINYLKEYYHSSSNKELIEASYKDWRFAIPSSISTDGVSVPRTPKVKLENDPNWFGIDQLSDKMQEIVTDRWSKRHKR